MDKKIYKSKIGLELAIPLTLILGGTLFLLFLQPASWLGIVILILAIFFILHLFLTTYYIITDEELFIKSGMIYQVKIPISSIKKIEKTNSLFSAPATSLDRIVVYYDEKKMVVISPKEKQAFAAHLKLLNPIIDINTKLLT